MSAILRLQDWVARSAERFPDAVAVKGEGTTLSYASLEALSNRIAWLLRHAGCGTGDRVGLLMSKAPDAVAALVGIYKAGGIAVPLDATNPAARLARVIRHCQARLLVAGRGMGRRLEELADGGDLGSVSLLWMAPPEDLEERGLHPAFGLADVAGQPDAPVPGGAAEAAHILFTSGSTGEPKGVIVKHESVIRFVEWAVRHFGITHDDRLSGHSPLHFDLSTFDLFGAFAAGAELHLVPTDMNVLPHRLAERIRDARLTQWFSVPSVLTYMAHFDVVKQDDFPELRRLLWCGETFPTPCLIHWMNRLPHVAFTNLYGPTEATIASSYHDVPRIPEDGRASVPIGKACEGEELVVLDEGLGPLPPGAVGELFIGGVGLSPGYFRDPERTQKAFVSRPGVPGDRLYRTGDLAWVDDEGLVHLVGRTDSQIKSRGYRIELGEIENAIAATGLTREAVVTAVGTSGFEGQSICCAYVPSADAPPAEVRRELARLLPAYMIPSRWSVCREIPRNANGKLDRRRVRASFERYDRDAAAQAS